MTLLQPLGVTSGKLRLLARMLIVTAMLLASGQSAVAASGSQQSSDANHRLGAIKQALIDLSLGTELRVTSSGYIDDRGALHESSMITSQSQVRGIRVLSYLEEAGLQVANIEATAVADNCPAVRPGLRRQARISVLPEIQDTRIGDHYISELGALSQTLLSAAVAQAGTWSAASEEQFSSSYHRKMSATSGNRPPFEIQVRLRNAEPEKGPELDNLPRNNSLTWKIARTQIFSQRSSWPNQLLALELRLRDPLLGTVVLFDKTLLEYPRLKRGYDKTQLPPEFIEQLSGITQRFVEQMDAALECRRDYYHVSNSRDSGAVSGTQFGTRFGTASDNGVSRLRINAGTIAGIQVGDQFLISPTPQITGLGADLADIQKLLLAEVQSVDAQGATLQVTAGGDDTAAATGHALRHNLNHYVAIYF